MNKNIERVTNHAVENFKNYIIFLCLPLIGIDDEDISAIKQQSFLMDEIDYNKAESSGDYFNSLKLLVSNDRTVILYKRHLFGNDLYFKIRDDIDLYMPDIVVGMIGINDMIDYNN